MESELSEVAPIDWRRLPIEAVCSRVTSGGTPSRKRPDFYIGGKWNWVKTQELTDTWIDKTEEKITDDAIASSSAKVLPSNTVLLALYGATVGQLGILRKEMTCNQACCAMIVDPSKADYRFLFYQLLVSRSQLKRLATGAAQQNLSGQLIKAFKLPFPPIKEQKAIACILGALDDKIEFNQRRNQTLQDIARAIFQSWFVEFDPVRAKAAGRTPPRLNPELAALFPDSFEDSVLGEIPKGWRVGKVRELCEKVENGGTPKRQIEEYWNPKEVPWLTSGEVRQPFVVNTENYISKSGFDSSSAKMWPPFTTVVALYGATAGIATILGMELCANQACCGLVPKANASCFIHQLISGCLTSLQQQARGSAQQNLSQSIVADFSCLIPSCEILVAFEKVVHCQYQRCIDGIIESHHLAALRDTLIPKLISGDLRVPDAERIVGRAI